MEFWKQNTIWVDQLPNESFLTLDLKQEKINAEEIKRIEYLTLWYHKSKSRDLSEMPELKNLQYFELNWSNIHNFNGADKFTDLKRLEVHYCTKLISDYGISKLSKSLEHLHINQSKKFVPSEELFELKNLRVLCLNSCGDLENLSFLQYFPKLIEFRFVNTNILDGDLTPIVDHQSIRTVGYINKRHYNISEKRMDELLLNKCSEPYKVVIERGQYSTYKYLD